MMERDQFGFLFTRPAITISVWIRIARSLALSGDGFLDIFVIILGSGASGLARILGDGFI
jgi:hypothetical protein